MATKPRFSSTGTRSDRLIGAAEAVDGGAEAMRRRIRLAIEIDGDRQVRPEPLDALDVLSARSGGEGLRVAGREGCPVFRQQALPPRGPERGDGIRQPVGPGAQDFDDPALQRPRTSTSGVAPS